MSDPWDVEELERRAAVNAEGARRRRERWPAFLAAHGDGVRRWSGAAWSRLEVLVERINFWTRGVCGPKPARASRWPWRRWAGSNVLVANLTEQEAREMREPRRRREPRWLDRRGPKVVRW